jgi:hypothetical protein
MAAAIAEADGQDAGPTKARNLTDGTPVVRRFYSLSGTNRNGGKTLAKRAGHSLPSAVLERKMTGKMPVLLREKREGEPLY